MWIWEPYLHCFVFLYLNEDELSTLKVDISIKYGNQDDN